MTQKHRLGSGLVQSFIHSFAYKTVTEHLLCARHCPRTRCSTDTGDRALVRSQPHLKNLSLGGWECSRQNKAAQQRREMIPVYAFSFPPICF